MKLYSLDEVIGKKKTKERDEFERKVEEALHAYRNGPANNLEPVNGPVNGPVMDL